MLVTPDDSNVAFAGTWHVTTKGHNTVYEGTLTLNVDHDFDLTGEVRGLVMPNNEVPN